MCGDTKAVGKSAGQFTPYSSILTVRRGNLKSDLRVHRLMDHTGTEVNRILI